MIKHCLCFFLYKFEPFLVLEQIIIIIIIFSTWNQTYDLTVYQAGIYTAELKPQL